MAEILQTWINDLMQDCGKSSAEATELSVFH